MTDSTITVAVPPGSKLSSEDRPGRIESLPKGHMLTMGTVHAQRLAEELDREANPWGEPGECPEYEDGPYFMTDGHDVWAVVIVTVDDETTIYLDEGGEATWHGMAWKFIDDEMTFKHRAQFRNRRTPEAPR